MQNFTISLLTLKNRGNEPYHLSFRITDYIETEIVLLMAILFTVECLASTSPAIDTVFLSIVTLFVFMLGMIEITARMNQYSHSKLCYFLPILSSFGGLKLPARSHVGFEAKTTFLMQVGHTLMGGFSLTLAGRRWLEIKQDSHEKEIASFISVVSLFQIGLILMFYREPLY